MKKYNIILITVLIVTSLCAYEDMYIVKQDGTGDFTTIEEAVNAVQNSGVIYVYGGTYNNVNVNWNGSSKHIYLRGIGEPIITDSSTAFYISYGNETDKIQGFNFENCSAIDGGAIKSINGSIEIIDNTFTNCHTSYFTVGADDYEISIHGRASQGGAIYINHSESSQQSKIINNTFTDCVSYDGGALYIEGGEIEISENTFADNHSCWYETTDVSDNGEGGAIYLNDTKAEIVNNVFTGNSSSSAGIAIYKNNPETSDILQSNTFSGNYHTQAVALYEPSLIYGITEITNNVFRDHVSSHPQDIDFYLFGPGANIINNTFINNDVSFSQFNNHVVKNNIFYDSIIQAQTLENCVIYNCTATNNTMTNCIQTDPQLDINLIPIWNSTTLSPCIDAGVADILDADGTRSDIGAFHAINHDFHETIANAGRYRWVSFPVIDRNIVVEGEETEYICSPVEDDTDYFKIFDEYGNIAVWSGNPPYWSINNGILILDSKEGYKISTANDVLIPTSGTSLPENTTVSLDAGENWVGYFVKETLPIDVAFADIWDHIQSIYGEDWAWKKGETIPANRCGLIYGKMYIVNVDQPCSFVYNQSGGGITPKERTMPTGFNYTETPEYMPITVTGLGSRGNAEIGVLLDGECIGASEIDGDQVQILAFVPGNYDGDGEVTFQIYDGNRGYKTYSSYQVLGARNQRSLKLQINEFATVRLGDETEDIETLNKVGNYPNPFNPTTNINFSIVDNASNVLVEIYNVKGQKIRTLLNEKLSSGNHSVIWNGMDNSNNKVASGIYFYRIKTSEMDVSKKMMIMK